MDEQIKKQSIQKSLSSDFDRDVKAEPSWKIDLGDAPLDDEPDSDLVEYVKEKRRDRFNGSRQLEDFELGDEPAGESDLFSDIDLGDDWFAGERSPETQPKSQTPTAPIESKDNPPKPKHFLSNFSLNFDFFQRRKDARTEAQKRESANENSPRDRPEEATVHSPAIPGEKQGGGETDIAPIASRIIEIGLTEGADEIYLEPQADSLLIRLRKDGMLQEPLTDLPEKVGPALLSYLKNLAELDAEKQQVPQQGHFTRVFQGRNRDFLMSTLPSRYGERAILKILGNADIDRGLGDFISDSETLHAIRKIIARPYGLILIVGPSESGKTTTIAAALAERSNPGTNIFTVEDPIEYNLPGVVQVEVNQNRGMDFAATLQSVLREKSAAIFVGDIPNRATAQMAVEAAFGRLVLASLHAPDAAGAIARLKAMGIEPELIASVAIGIVNQRLVRRLCSECCIPYKPTAEELTAFGLFSTTARDIAFSTVYKAATVPLKEREEAQLNGELCPHCQGVGYCGRVGVFEVMPITESLKSAIARGTFAEESKKIAVEEGMTTLFDYSLDLVLQGETSFEEVERAILAESPLASQLRYSRKLREQLNSPQQQLQELKSLRQRLEEVEKEKEDLIKALQQQPAELREKRTVEVFQELLKTLDSFEKAKGQIKLKTERETAIHKGYQGIYRQLETAVKNLGISVIEVEGKPFDTELHEVVEREVTDEYAEGTAIAEIRRGYLLGDRVLRRAQVKIAARSADIPAE